MPLNPKQAPRIALAAPPFDDLIADALRQLGPPIQLFRVLAPHPSLVEAVGSWGRYFWSGGSALSVRQRELVIDRTVARCGADYEWGVHTAWFATRAGLTSDQLASLARGSAEDACWQDASDRAVLRAVDELHDAHDLSDAAWRALCDTLGSKGALDLTLLCGWYHAVSFAVRALRLPLEPGTRPLPERASTGGRRRTTGGSDGSWPPASRSDLG